MQKRYFRRSLRAMQGNVVLSLNQLDEVLALNRVLKKEIKELQDQLIDEKRNYNSKDFDDYRFQAITEDGSVYNGRLKYIYDCISLKKLYVIDERESKIVIDYVKNQDNA